MNNSYINEFFYGCFGGVLGTIISHPIDTIRINLQSSKIPQYTFKNLYKGSLACFSRDMPFSLIYFPLYDYLKTSMNINDSPLEYLIPGTIAGFVSAFTTTPCDVVKTRLQTLRSDSVKYTGIYDCFKKIYQNEGITAFYKGSIVRSLRSSIQFGITLMCYEMLKKNY